MAKEMHTLTLTRFNPGNAHVCGLSRHGALVGSGELDGDQTKAEGHEVLPRFGPLGRVTTYILLACLLLMEWLKWRCYNGGVDWI
jgi:hypothetical protein